MSHKIGLYIRVSTEEQALRTEGSLDSQRHRLVAFLDLKNGQDPGWGRAIESYIDDGFSAGDTNRPALQRLLSDIKSGRINMILITDLSRLSRSIRDFCGLLDLFKETRTKFLSLKDQFDTTTAAGEMMLFNMINLAQFERRQISERVTMNFHSRALRGLRNGGNPALGFYVDAKNKAVLQINASEVGYVRTVFEVFLAEGSLYKAASVLRERRIPCCATGVKPTGNSPSIWNTQVLSSLLRNYSYAGQREVNKGNKHRNPEELQAHEKYQVVKAAWPAIIDEATFFTVQKMLDDNRKLERARLAKGKRRAFSLTGISVCGECGRPLVGSTGHGRTKEIRYYVHRPLEGVPVTCAVKRFRADEVEDQIANHLLNVVEREGYLNGIEKTFSDLYASENASSVSQKRNLERKVAQADVDIKKVIRTQIQTEDKDLHEHYSAQLKEIHEERKADMEQLERLNRTPGSSASPTAMREAVGSNMKHFQRAWAKASPSLQKQLIRAVVHGLVFRIDCIDLFYNTDKVTEIILPHGQESGSAGAPPVDLASARQARADRSAATALGLSGFTHYKKVSGWDIGEIGCGGWI